MFKTIRFKLLTIIALILLFTAVIIIYFTHRDVGREMTRVEQNNAENIINSVYLNIQGVYRGLISERVRSIDKAKKRLSSETRIILSSFDFFVQQKGLYLAEDKSLGKERFKKWLQELKPDIANFFIADADFEVIFDADKELLGHNLEQIRDIRGEPLAKAINKQGRAYNQFVVFSPGKQEEDVEKKLGYLTYFPYWEWVLGAFVDISSIEEAEEARIKQMRQELKSQFEKTRLAQTGSLFIFNEHNELLVVPDGLEISEGIKSLLPILVQAAHAGKLEQVSVNQKNMFSYTRYFKPLGWYVSALIPQSEIQAPARKLVKRQSLIIVFIFLLGTVAAVFFVRHISKPLALLAEHSRGLASSDLTSEETDFQNIRGLTEKYRDEVGELAGSFMYMQKELKKNVRSLLKSTAANERYESELNMARDIQMSIVPKKFPAFPGVNEFDLYALLEPAREVGGDLYDFFLLDDGQLCFAVGDVSDKGMPAALYMAITRTLVQTHAAREKSPGKIMALVNNDLSKDNPKSMFVTLIIGIMDIKTGHISYANAGHNLPVVLSKEGECSFVQGLSGPVAGAMEDIKYKELHLDLQSGDRLFVYTDGVTEAMNPGLEMFSDARLLQDVSQAQDMEITKLLQDIRDRVRTFSDGAAQSDDITMFILKYNGQNISDNSG